MIAMPRLGLIACAALLLPSLAWAAPPAGGKYALVVGVKEYDSSHFEPLAYTENDAEKLAALLSSRGFKVRLLTTGRGKKDRKDAPTAANIRKELAALAGGKKRSD